MLKACIFDLDGVLTDTARYHFKAWAEVAKELGFTLTESQNELLKGVSRTDSYQKILEWAGVSSDEEQTNRLLLKKNELYLELILQIGPNDVFPGVIDLLKDLQKVGVKIALGSSSKNAVAILDKLQLLSYFDAISDGTNVVKSKPDPEVFLTAADKLQVDPSTCVVIEDAPAGVEAAIAAGMKCVGIGDENILSSAHLCLSDLKNVSLSKLQSLF